MPDAKYYRIGWVAYPDYQEISEVGGRPWSEAFVFVDVENLGQTSRTVRRLTPGVLYAFRVGTMTDENTAPLPSSYSSWVLFTVQAGVACPIDTTTPVTPAPVAGDYDKDNDGLIEISSLEQLDAIRYDLNGDGLVDNDQNDAAYSATFPNAADGMGCPSGGCKGYELTDDLDFGSVVTGAGWQPIGGVSNPFNATFDGNGHTISNLYIARNNEHYIGLFGRAGEASVIRGVGVENVYILGRNGTGALVGRSDGTINDSYATGEVSGAKSVGGLVGSSYGSITASHATSEVTGIRYIGGLVGYNNGGAITSSYATGDATVTTRGLGEGGDVGGLVGVNGGTITTSYATGKVTAHYCHPAAAGCWRPGGGLVGYNGGTITSSYATGTIDMGLASWAGGSWGGGLVGVNEGIITSSYATGAGGYGFVRSNSGTITFNYWDTEASGTENSRGGEGKTTAELQTPTSNTGIYSRWDPKQWDFGTAQQYPVLKVAGLSVADQRQ